MFECYIRHLQSVIQPLASTTGLKTIIRLVSAAIFLCQVRYLHLRNLFAGAGGVLPCRHKKRLSCFDVNVSNWS